MAAWYGYHHERLPHWLKSPAKGAIIGGIIGIVAGLLTGLNPFLFGVGLIAAGATIGAVMNLGRGNEVESLEKNISPARKQALSEPDLSKSFGIEEEIRDSKFQRMVSEKIGYKEYVNR